MKVCGFACSVALLYWGDKEQRSHEEAREMELKKSFSV